MAFFHIIASVCCISSLVSSAVGGNCWALIGANGRCQHLVSSGKTREDCCTLTGSMGATLAYSSDDLDSGALFRYTALLGGAPNCQSCRKTCDGVNCGENKVCHMQNGQPKCVCKPKCDGLPTGRVCGSDGKTYRNHCSLLQLNCHFNRAEWVNYYGKCRSSCNRVSCPTGTSCILDDNHRRTHCVRCTTSCPDDLPQNLLCGMDGKTYQNDCSLRAASCKNGGGIALAYEGSCKEFATCRNLTCTDPNHKCLTHPTSGHPQCSNCNLSCGTESDKICGRNGKTYANHCELRKASCQLGTIIETAYVGECGNSQVTTLDDLPSSGISLGSV